MQTRSLLFAVTVFALVACPEPLTAERATWDTTTKGWAARVEKMKKGHEELATKVKAFSAPDSEPALQADKAALDKAVGEGTTAITDAEHEMATAKTTIEKLISNGKKVQLEVALGTTKATVDGTLARAESLVSSANSALETLARKSQAARASGDAAKSRTEAWLAEVKKKGAMVLVEDLAFAGEALNVDQSKVALASLVGTLKGCPDLKVELAVVALGEGELGNKRAEAIKAHLLANGVNAAVLAKVSGTATPEGEEKISFTVVAPCK